MKFPALDHLGLGPANVDFRHARGLDMNRHVSGASWEYEPDVLATLLCLLHRYPRSTFINVGANVGYFPIIIERLFDRRVDVHVYEPMPELAGRLRTGRDRNALRFRLSESALSDFCGTAPFHLSAKSDTSNSLNPHFRPAKEVVEVAVSTLDEEFPPPRLISRVGRRPTAIQGATVLLIDTESTEPDVLKGGLDFIDRVRPAIICEVLAGRTEEALGTIIAEVGYVPYALGDDGIERRDEVIGDRTYTHRDWLFLPAGVEPPSNECYLATISVLRQPGRD